MRRPLPALAILAVVSMTRVGRAERTSLPLELTWDAPSGCPDAAVVVRRVEQILRGSQVAPTTVIARAKVSGTDDGRFELALTLRAEDVEDSRTIVASSCSALAHASAVVIALAIDPTTDVPADERAPEEQPPPAPPSSASAKREAPRHPAPPAQSSSRVAVGLGAAAVAGTLPEVGGGLSLSASLRFHRLRAGVLGTFWLPQSPQFDRVAGASFDLIDAGAFAAYLFPLGPVELGPTAGFEVTHARVEGFGIRDPHAFSLVWPTAVVGMRSEMRVNRWLGLFARADALFPIDKPTFTLATTETGLRLFQPAVVSPRFSLGIEVLFP